ncbi:MAG: Hsp20/alpha crystallin family protein, partial [Candidatus Bathyarchaeia archaeon]
PLKRPPMLAKTAAAQKKAVKEMREPLTDIFEENNAFKVYIELPGEEKEDITFTIKGGTLEVKAKNFYKTIKLPSDHINAEKSTSQYKNGVLTITIPKNKTP